MEDTQHHIQQVEPIFILYKNLISSLSHDQLTWKFFHQLKGIQKCLEKGENTDLVPNPEDRYEKYYEWYYWHEFSNLILNKYPEVTEEHDLFHYYAMLLYIRMAHQYLQFIHMIN